MKHLTIVFVLILGVGLCAATTGNRVFENLKVLPKDISSKDLQGIMADDFKTGSG